MREYIPRFGVELFTRSLELGVRMLSDLPQLLRPRGIRGTQTREVDVLGELFRRVKTADVTGDYTHVEEMIDQDAVLLTREGEEKGIETIIRHLREMGGQGRYRVQIVAPKGGLIAVLIHPVSFEGVTVGRGREQTYRLRQDKLIELIDLGRTPDMVYRPESQPF